MPQKKSPLFELKFLPPESFSYSKTYNFYKVHLLSLLFMKKLRCYHIFYRSYKGPEICKDISKKNMADQHMQNLQALCRICQCLLPKDQRNSFEVANVREQLLNYMYIDIQIYFLVVAKIRYSCKCNFKQSQFSENQNL